MDHTGLARELQTVIVWMVLLFRRRILPAMGFWQTTLTNVLGGLGAGLFFLFWYVLIQWFLRATDLVVSYAWSFDTVAGMAVNIRPNFDIRNRSGSRLYRLANIAYTRHGQPHWFDNSSLWGAVLEPGSINVGIQGAPIPRLDGLPDALSLEVTITLQTGRRFWLRGQGPGQMGRGRIRRAALALRRKLESWLISLE